MIKIRRKLLGWYRKAARDLPWRKTRDPYRIWISEVMLQQTTVNAVIPYYESWVADFPTIQAVAETPLQLILKKWQGLGYYQRAKNLHLAAGIIVNDLGGEIPRNRDVLRKLPGFGPYTTGAVLSIAFDQREVIVDANVRRVVQRLLALEDVSGKELENIIEDFLWAVLPRRDVSSFNQALMELGALVCKSRQPLCNQCPLRSDCRAFEKGIQELIPASKRKPVEKVKAVIGLLRKNGSYLIQQRTGKGLFADLWEFPGGKVEKGEGQVEALRREMREELNARIAKVKPFMKVRHYYTRFAVDLHAFTCEPQSDIAVDASRKWVSLNGLQKYPMPSGSAKIVDKLLNQ